MHRALCMHVSEALTTACLYLISTSTRFHLSIALLDTAMRTGPSVPPVGTIVIDQNTGADA
jgi:hypothetical protein